MYNFCAGTECAPARAKRTRLSPGAPAAPEEMPDQCGELGAADYGEETRPGGLQCATDDETVGAPGEHNNSSSSDEEDEAEAQADVAGTTETPESKAEQRRLKKLADEGVEWPSIEPGVALPGVLRREEPISCKEGAPNKSRCTRKAGDHSHEYRAHIIHAAPAAWPGRGLGCRRRGRRARRRGRAQRVVRQPRGRRRRKHPLRACDHGACAWLGRGLSPNAAGGPQRDPQGETVMCQWCSSKAKLAKKKPTAAEWKQLCGGAQEPKSKEPGRGGANTCCAGCCVHFCSLGCMREMHRHG